MLGKTLWLLYFILQILLLWLIFRTVERSVITQVKLAAIKDRNQWRQQLNRTTDHCSDNCQIMTGLSRGMNEIYKEVEGIKQRYEKELVAISK